MRIFNRAHVPWAIFVVLATLFAAWLYVGNFNPQILPSGLRLPPGLAQKPSEHRSVGGTPLGLIFGAISFGIFIFAALLGVRKKLVLWRVGTVQRWLRAHIWLTLLTVPLVLLHSGFRLGGPMTVLLMALYAIVMVSGIYGLFLQHLVPRIMKERLPVETVYEQIPHIRSRLFLAAQQMHNSLQRAMLAPPPSPALPTGEASGDQTVVALADPESEAALVTFLEDQVMPYLDERRGSKSHLWDRGYSEDAFRFVNLSVDESYRSRLEEIRSWCDERRMLDLQTRLHHWLHGWLFIHVPFSFLLLLLTAWHAVVTLFYY
jgi:hypothetical protein